MANRRMISKEIIDGDYFTELPISTKLLYLEIVVHADDFGFCRSLKILFAISESGEDDLAELEKSGFIFRFDSGVVCVRHWFLHNTIQKDRVHETQFQKELSALTKINGVYEWNTVGNILETDCIHDYSEMETELDKYKLSKSNQLDKRARVSKFQDFFSAYPKKKSMVSAHKEYCLLLFNDQNLIEPDLIDAAGNYAESVSILGTDERYIKNPDRFLKDGTYLDYLNANYKKPTPKKATSKNTFNQFQQHDYDFATLEKELLGN